MIVTLDTFMEEPFKLPNARTAPNSADNTREIQGYIDVFEREILIKGLGPSLYQLVKDNYTGTTLKSDAPQRIKDLVKGVDYTIDTKQYSWLGLSDMIAYYVYYKFLVKNQNYFSTFGVERPKGKGSEPVSANLRGVQYYREFHHRYQSADSPIRSLKMYLEDKSTTYSEYQFTEVGGVNRFGL